MDSFKGCLTSAEAGEAVRGGVLRAYPDAEVSVLEIADGGEGTGKALHRYLGGEVIEMDCHDAIGRSRRGRIVLLPSSDGGTAIVELAEAAGITHLKGKERDVMRTTTYGFGELIAGAISHGARKVICTLGGSATNDAGLGALQALGLILYDKKGRVMDRPIAGEELRNIGQIDPSALRSRLSGVEIEYLYDAEIDFTGPHGAVAMYSAQKGATDKDFPLLEEGMENVARLLHDMTGKDPAELPGAGAAGGAGAGLGLLAGAHPRSGIAAVLDAARFDDMLRDADVVITGEGHADVQTCQGKAARGVLERAGKGGVPVMLFAGRVDDRELLMADGYLSITDINEGQSKEIDPCIPAIAKERLEDAVARVIAAEKLFARGLER